MRPALAGPEIGVWRSLGPPDPFPMRLLLSTLALLFATTACAQDDMTDDADGADSISAFFDALPPARASDEARVSPNAYVGTTVGTTDVFVQYGRPSLRGRSYFEEGAELAPVGAVWRTGANEAPTVTFSDDVRVEDQSVPAGTYSLFTVPGADTWTVILNDTAEQWGAFRYDEAMDRIRVSVQPMVDAPMQEQFEIRFSEVTEASATMLLHWGTVAVPVEITEGSR